MHGEALNSIAAVRERAGGLSRSMVYRLIRDGELQRVKVGTRSFITESSLQAFFERLTGRGAV